MTASINNRRPQNPAPALAFALASIAALALVAACGGRKLGVGNEDGAVGVDAQVPIDSQVPDGEVVDPCEPMDAFEPFAQCDDPPPLLGWAWDGSCCVPIHCVCVGEDCDRLHDTQSDCASAHVPGCIPVTPCENRDYGECDQLPGCEVIYYGGGCFNMQECDPDGGHPDEMICIERAFACVPTGQACNERDQSDCTGDCFYVRHDSELCYEQCCFDEGFGYCTSLPSCDCEPQEITGCADPCGDIVGYYWNGDTCAPILCCCEGPDCDQTWQTSDECWAARATCPTPD